MLFAPAAGAQVDLRVLVDVSGSMRQNDPRGLRSPALRLLVELLPEGARAGVWTFGARIRPEVPHGPVDAAWRARARQVADGLPADEQWTDMEGALNAAMDGWAGPDPEAERHVVLLTDGLVDVGPDPERDAASRRRILGDMRLRLKEAGAQVHTVALSKNADEALLAQLSLETDGWMERVADAGELNRVFLRLFEKAAPAPQVPIAPDNSFRVDAAVRDMTLVVLHAEDAPPTALEGPDGTRYLAAGPLPDAVRWQAEAGYDLVTVEAPAAGTWRIHAPHDPDNRVLVVTNLALEVEPLPNHVMLGHPLEVRARLEEDGAPVSRGELLELVTFQARLEGAGGEPEWLTLEPEAGAEPPAHGITVALSGDPGERELRVRADGGTFVREHRHPLRVHLAPGEIRLEPLAAGGHRVVAQVVEDVVRLDTVAATVRSLEPGGGVRQLEAAAPTRWEGRLGDALAGAMVELALTGQRKDGEPFALQLERRVPPAEPVAAPAEPTPPAPEERPRWQRIWSVVGLLNLFLWPLAAAGAWWWRRRRRQREHELAEALAL